MWRLLKTELIYNRYQTGWAFLLWFAFFIKYLFMVQHQSMHKMGITIILLAMLITPMIAGYFGDFRMKQKRDRIHTKLPIPLYETGIIRLIYPLIIWVGVIAVFYLSTTTVTWIINPLPFSQGGFKIPRPLHLINLNGWIMTINALYLIIFDLKAINPKPKIHLNALRYIISLGAILPFQVYIIGGHSIGNASIRFFWENLSVSPVLAFVINFVGINLSVIEIVLYCRRNTYLNS